MHFNTIVIGGGPGGLYTAYNVGKYKKSVLVLERNKRAGRKLLVSGAGQCNFTHAGPIEDFFDCYHEQGKFVKKALQVLDNKKMIRFFEERGVACQTLPNNKVFPKSMKSEDVLNTLLRACQVVGVEIRYNECVEQVSMYDGMYAVETVDGRRYICNQLVIATGGKSYPQLGSDGLGYRLAESLGHTIISPRPALTDVRLSPNPYKEISGVSIKDVCMSVWRGGRKIKEGNGDLLFTHRGLSGPVIINTSRWMQEGDELVINFVAPSTYEQVKELCAQNLAQRGKEEVITFLRQFGLPKNLLQLLCIQIKLDEHMACAQLNKTMREQLVNVLTRCKFVVNQLGGFNIAMVTTGGVHLKEINPTTLESRKHKGLYFVGEVIDIDGITGGYNIQAAFSMGYLCAKHIGTL